MLRYLYCAVSEEAELDLSGWRGEGAPLSVVRAGGIGGVLGEVSPARYGARALARALDGIDSIAPYAVAHQAVVQYVFERTPAIVPLAFGSVHRTRADALRTLAAEAPRLRRLLKRLAGAQEWGLRVTWKARAPSIDPSAPGAGTAYLAARRRELRDRAPDPEALRVAERLAERIARRSIAQRPTPAREGDLVLRVAYLIPASRAPEVRRLVLDSADAVGAAGLAAELSGPWPPYSFTGRGTGLTRDDGSAKARAERVPVAR
jgi:hypothetical protein